MDDWEERELGGMGIGRNGNWEEWKLGGMGIGGTEEKVRRARANPHPACQCSQLPLFPYSYPPKSKLAKHPPNKETSCFLYTHES